MFLVIQFTHQLYIVSVIAVIPFAVLSVKFVFVFIAPSSESFVLRRLDIQSLHQFTNCQVCFHGYKLLISLSIRVTSRPVHAIQIMMMTIVRVRQPQPPPLLLFSIVLFLSIIHQFLSILFIGLVAHFDSLINICNATDSSTTLINNGVCHNDASKGETFRIDAAGVSVGFNWCKACSTSSLFRVTSHMEVPTILAGEHVIHCFVPF